MLTAHIITKNNIQNIKPTIDSLLPLKCPIKIVDIGSDDGTPNLLRQLGISVEHMQTYDRSLALSRIAQGSGWHLLIRPGEILVDGHKQLLNYRGTASHIRLIRGSFISYEVRIWTGETRINNPIWPYPTIETDSLINVNVFGPPSDAQEELKEVNSWIDRQPTLAEPHYCKAMIFFALTNYESFLHEIEQYLFMETAHGSKTVTMARYHHALVNLIQGRSVQDTLKQLNLCVCMAPLMAEFWCAMGDVYYHRLNKFEEAKQFYENAIFLGSKRMSNDLWPMDITKYEEYPNLMIESCNKIIAHRSIYYTQ